MLYVLPYNVKMKWQYLFIACVIYCIEILIYSIYIKLKTENVKRYHLTTLNFFNSYLWHIDDLYKNNMMTMMDAYLYIYKYIFY